MKGQTNQRILKPKLQRRLRTNMTDAEHRLWSILRGRQLEDCKFRRQHPYERYVLDFVCLDIGLVIEVDGGQHSDHQRDDAVRGQHLEKAGFRVVRFWNHDVLQHTDAVADAIWRAVIELKQTRPHPSPPPEGEGAKAPALSSSSPAEGEGAKTPALSSSSPAEGEGAKTPSLSPNPPHEGQGEEHNA